MARLSNLKIVLYKYDLKSHDLTDIYYIFISHKTIKLYLEFTIVVNKK